MSHGDLEKRLQRIEDVLEIQHLKARYLDAADGGWDRDSHNAELIAGLFTEDGWWHSESHDRLDGRDAIRAGFATFTDALPFAYHVITNPLIEVEGDHASAEWHVTWMGTSAEGQELWAAGIYTDELLRTPDGWRFKSVFCRMAYFGPHADGWAASMGTVKTLGSARSVDRA